MGAAVDYYAFDRQKEREYQFAPSEKMRLRYKGKTNYRDEIGEETYSWLTHYIESRIDGRPWETLRTDR